MRLVLIAAALTLTSCGASSYKPTEKEVAKWTDPETGCVYLNYRSGWPTNAAIGSLSVRFRRDGKPDCPGVDGDTDQSNPPKGLARPPLGS